MKTVKKRDRLRQCEPLEHYQIIYDKLCPAKSVDFQRVSE